MVIECPHCYTRVFVKDAGVCPACQKDVHSAPKENLQKASLAIDEEATLPPVCCDCGVPTDRYVKVKGRISLENQSNSELGGWGLALLSPMHAGIHMALILISWMRGEFSPRIGDVVMIRMPQCDNCSQNGPPAPIYVSPEVRQMTFVVHKQFKNQVLKPSKDSSGQM